MIRKLINTEDKRRLVGNFFSLIVLRGFQFLIPLITLPYLVRTIGLDNFGLVNFALSLALYFGAVIQFGFGVTATREIARNRDDKVKLSKIYSVTLTASFLLALISAITFGLIVMVFDRFNQYLYLYLFTMLFVIFQSLFPIWFFQGVEKMKYITFLSLGTSVMFLISLFVFVRQEADFFLVPLLNAIAAFITFTMAIAIIKKQFKVNFIRPKIEDIKLTYQNGYHAFVSQLAPNLYNNSAVFLLGLFANNTLVGLYTAATKVIDAVISLAYILSNTFLPYLSRNLQSHKIFQDIMLASGTVLTIATYAMADWIARFLFSVDNIEIATYIQFLAICILLLFVTMTYGTNFLMLIGKDRVVKNIALYTSLFFFGIAFFIIPLWGIWGAIATLVGARLTMMLAIVLFYFKFKAQLQSI
ncbi:teichoic acid transporter [Marinomonas pontica]|uniref:Teichoic acid transporter n=1 Tax=Marinomonas pontica TaxID=264739 RepID=A0ABM8FFZ4_9GAMM|nr:teichoic acid transporter [Marinomonas pontica]